MTIDEKLKRLTKAHNLNALARVAGVSKVTLHLALNGSRQPHNGTILLLARALNVDDQWLSDDAQDWPPVWKHSEGRIAVA